MYDNKVACIQAKRIYKKFFKISEQINSSAGYNDLIDPFNSLLESFDFFIDIIHLMDNPEGEDINIINVFRGKNPGKVAECHYRTR